METQTDKYWFGYTLVFMSSNIEISRKFCENSLIKKVLFLDNIGSYSQ